MRKVTGKNHSWYTRGGMSVCSDDADIAREAYLVVMANFFDMRGDTGMA